MAFTFTLCADDYGLTEGVSRGILEVALAGCISAASAITSMPDWPRAADAWRKAAPLAGLGLHINLTVGAPLGAMPSFAPANTFPSIGTVVRGALPADEIEAEVGRQIDAFVSNAGRPTHVDGHQHVHAFPGVRRAVFRALVGRGLTSVSLRDPSDSAARILRRGGPVVKTVLVGRLARGFADEARAAGFSCNDGFAGFSSFDPQADMARLFARYLTAPGPNHLVMCHPGHVDAPLRALDPVTEARESELRFLLSDGWPGLMAQAGGSLREPDAQT